MARLRALGRDADGEPVYELVLPEVEATLLASLPQQLETLLRDPEGNRRIVERLFPATYDDPADEREHRRLLGATLWEERRERTRYVARGLEGARTAGADTIVRLSGPEADLWLRFVNDVRLVLATDLGIEDDVHEERQRAEAVDQPRFLVLDYLGYLEMLLIRAAGGAPGDP